MMSVHGGEAEIICSFRVFRILTRTGLANDFAFAPAKLTALAHLSASLARRRLPKSLGSFARPIPAYPLSAQQERYTIQSNFRDRRGFHWLKHPRTKRQRKRPAAAPELDAFDVSALERSLNDSATRVSTLWVSFLIFSLYLLNTAATVTHRQLLLAEPLKLPVLDSLCRCGVSFS